MADRPRGFGMTAELQDKKAAKYDLELAGQVVAWVNDVNEGECDCDGPEADAVHASLKDGAILCALINKIQPGSVKKVNTSKMAFKQMENTNNFLEACYAYGVPKLDLFQTVDLYESQNMPQVINGLIAVSRKAAAKGFSGPTIGPKESIQNVREFSDEQKKAGQNVIGLQMGSNKGASQAGMSYGKPRQIHDPTV